MYEIARSQRFKKSYKKISRLPKFKRDTFVYVINQLASGQKLPAKYHDHALIGNMIGLRECHLAPDILLIYKIENEILTLTLVNIGSHANLLKK